LNHSYCVGNKGYPVDDLFNLKPTRKELFEAYKWVLGQYDSAEVKSSLMALFGSRSVLPDPLLEKWIDNHR